MKAVLAVMVLVGAMAFWYRGRDHLRVFERRAGSLASAEITGSAIEEAPEREAADDRSSTGRVRVTELRIRGSRGLVFRATVRRPDSEQRLPAVLLLAGQRTGRRAAALPPLRTPVVQMAIDYPYQGPDMYSPVAFLMAVPKLRGALFDAAASGLLAVDYLAGRPDVDSVFVVGASFGAFFAPIAAASRPKVRALAVLQGGAGLVQLLAANLRHAGVNRFRQPIACLGAILLWPFEPSRWIGRVAPRPVLLVNGTEDERIPRKCVQRLYDAAGEPKKIVWIESGHLRPGNAALIERMTEEVEAAFLGGAGTVAPYRRLTP